MNVGANLSKSVVPLSPPLGPRPPPPHEPNHGNHDDHRGYQPDPKVRIVRSTPLIGDMYVHAA